MKANRAFIVVIIALMAMVVLFELNAPNRFRWDDFSQSYLSKQPFGCYVMDSVLSASLPQGYEVVGRGIEKYFNGHPQDSRHTFLFIGSIDDVTDYYDTDALKLLEAGNNVVLASDYGSNRSGRKLGFSFYNSSYNIHGYLGKETLSDRTLYDTVHWHHSDKFAPAAYMINSGFCEQGLSLSSEFSTLATINKVNNSHDAGGDDPEGGSGIIVAGIRGYGKGKIVVMSMPYIFTNYGILNDTIRPYALRLLSECGDLPVVRYDPSHVDDVADRQQDSSSPLHYLLANRPLRWAFYLALATLVAFVVFTAKRRQRVIPVINPPVNHMMDFVKRIGGIYYKRHDNVDLLLKKYATFSYDLRTREMIDISNDDHIDDELLLLSHRTGIPLNELQELISDLRDATGSLTISDERLQRLIDAMNNIMKRINI